MQLAFVLHLMGPLKEYSPRTNTGKGFLPFSLRVGNAIHYWSTALLHTVAVSSHL